MKETKQKAKAMPYPAGVASNPPMSVELQTRDLLAIKMIEQRANALEAEREQCFREIEAAYGIEAGGIRFYRFDGKVLTRMPAVEEPKEE